jgi:hypothetical protein
VIEVLLLLKYLTSDDSSGDPVGSWVALSSSWKESPWMGTAIGGVGAWSVELAVLD